MEDRGENELEYDGQRKSTLTKDGSLLSLFKSEFFTIHMLFRYLSQASQEGVVEYLVNKLYSEQITNIDYYIPQLW